MPKPGNFCNRLRENRELLMSLFSVRQWERWTLTIKEQAMTSVLWPTFPLCAPSAPLHMSKTFTTSECFQRICYNYENPNVLKNIDS